MKKQNDSKQQAERTTEQKKQYAKPQVVRHGNVESLTQTIIGGPSCPIQVG